MSANTNQIVRDNSDIRRYFAMIEHMADDDLDVYEYRLYGHYKRVCGEGNGRTCTEGARATAEKCGMSLGKVSSTRQSLADKGWITLTKHTEKTAGGKEFIREVEIEIVDRWAENVTRYAKTEAVREKTGESLRETCSPDEHPLSYSEHGCSPDELKNNNIKEQEKLIRAKGNVAQPGLALTAQDSDEALTPEPAAQDPHPPKRKRDPMFDLIADRGFKLGTSDTIPGARVKMVQKHFEGKGVRRNKSAPVIPGASPAVSLDEARRLFDWLDEQGIQIRDVQKYAEWLIAFRTTPAAKRYLSDTTPPPRHEDLHADVDDFLRLDANGHVIPDGVHS